MLTSESYAGSNLQFEPHFLFVNLICNGIRLIIQINSWVQVANQNPPEPKIQAVTRSA